MDPWDMLEPFDVIAKLPPKFIEDVESKKWQERRDALQTLLTMCTENPKLCPKANYGEHVAILKKVLEKDANINVCALSAKCITAFAKGLRKKFAPYATLVAPVIFEKFKEKRPLLKDPLCECIDAVIATTSLETVGEIVQVALEKQNPNIKIQTSLFLYREFTKCNAQNAPKKLLKIFIPIFLKHTGDSDPDVREASYSGLGAVMKAIGEKACMVLLTEIADDKTKMSKVLAARDRSFKDAAEAEALKREKETVESSSNASDIEKVKNAPQCPIEVDTWEMLEPVDVLAKLPEKFLEEVESKKWQMRRDALQTLLTLCNENPRLCPKSNYGEHISILKKILEKDANINVCALAARCLTAFATGLRKKFSPYVSLIVPVIFEKFKEKRPLLRDPLCECIDAVVASASLETMVEEVQGALEKANPNIKIQTNLFLYRVFMKYNAQTMPKKVLKVLVPVIIKHTGDSDPEVREASYSALGAAMKAIGEKACMVLLTPIVEDKTKMAKIRDFRDKAAKEAGSDVVSAMVQSIHKSDRDELEIDEQILETKKQSPLKPPVAVSVSGKRVSKNKVQDTDDASVAQTEFQAESNAEETVPTKESPLITNREKATRLKDEKNFKVLKWNFDQPTAEHVEQLHLQFTSVAIPSLCSMLFSKDFKQHLKALDVLDSLVVDDPNAVVANSDLILKWISLRFFETNQQVLLKALDLASKVFTTIQEASEPFGDAEMSSFVPYLFQLGETKDSVRGPVKKIFFLLVEIVGPAKIFPFVVDGLSIKNSRLRAECLQILIAIIASSGLEGTSTPGPSLKAIAGCISDRDSNVRNCALNAIVAAYKEAGDVVFQLIGKLNDKDQAMLEERIKRSGAVPKNKGSSNISTAPSGKKSRPVIGSAIKGGKMTPRKRSDSRNSSAVFNPSADDESSDEKSSINDETKNNTFLAEKQDEDVTMKSNRPRFSLDLKALGIDPNIPACPQLRDDEEISTLLSQPDLPVPRRTHALEPRRAESVCSITSLDSYAAADIDKAIHDIASISPKSAIQALSQLQYLFQEPGLLRFLAERIDIAIQAVVTQTSLIRSRHLSDFSLLDDVNDLIRLINNFLCSMVREHATCRRIKTEDLKMLIQEFLYLLKDERLKRLKRVREIVRSLNYLTIRICDNADPTSCYLALISMLTSALRDPQNETCIIKQSQQFLRDNFAKEVPMDMDSVMLAIHQFMEEFKHRADESSTLKEATRCIETSIQRLTVANGASILDHFSLVSDPANSEAFDYTQRCVKSWQKNMNNLSNSTFGSLPGQVAGASGDSLRHVVDGFIQDPFGKGFKDLLMCVKNVPSTKDAVFEMLKDNIPHREFLQYHLPRAMDEGRDMPDLLPEIRKAIESLRLIDSSLKDFVQTGVWGDNNENISSATSDQVETVSTGNRRFGQSNNVASGYDLPISESSSVTSCSTNAGHKQTLTASDVEPLRQLLIKRRGMHD
uniref:Cytoskeleton-associated protein 5 n=1 Tax=Syphacia muris TaxID=451379 RepID=A0A158R650_9BILA